MRGSVRGPVLRSTVLRGLVLRSPVLRGPVLRRLSSGPQDGALTLSYVIVMPAFLLGIMLVVQASVWYLARETALAAARQGADVARTASPPPGAGARAAVTFARSSAPGFLLAPSASAAGTSAATVRITVTGRVPSLVPGIVLRVSEVVTAPVERFTAVGPPAWTARSATRSVARSARSADRSTAAQDDRQEGERHA